MRPQCKRRLWLTGADDGAVTGGAGVAVVSYEQVPEESEDSSVALAAHFKIFANGNVSGKANPLGLEEC